MFKVTFEQFIYLRIVELIFLLFFIMINILNTFDAYLKKRESQKRKTPKKIFKTDVPLIKSVQEFKKLKKSKCRKFSFMWNCFYRIKDFLEKKVEEWGFWNIEIAHFYIFSNINLWLFDIIFYTKQVYFNCLFIVFS